MVHRFTMCASLSNPSATLICTAKNLNEIENGIDLVSVSLLLMQFELGGRVRLWFPSMPVLIVQKAPIPFQAHSLTLMHTQLVFFLLFPIGNGFKVLVCVTYAALIFVARSTATLSLSTGQSQPFTQAHAIFIRFTCNFNETTIFADFILFTILLCSLAYHFSLLNTSYFFFQLILLLLLLLPYQKVNILKCTGNI